jgi:hypothetical protein
LALANDLPSGAAAKRLHLLFILIPAVQQYFLPLFFHVLIPGGKPATTTLIQ